MLRYSFGGCLCLLAGIDVLIGSSWYLPLGVAVTGGIILLGQRRLFHAAVSRSGDEIVCRYIPWYEGNAYGALVLIPLMGVAMVAGGFSPGNPAWLRYGGAILLLGVTPLSFYGIVRMWRRSLLCITPSALTVRLVGRGSEVTGIRREQVDSIEPKVLPQPAGGESLQVVITYRPIDVGNDDVGSDDVGSDTTKTVILGPRLTVPPINLANALLAWKDGANDKPRELLDRIDVILRGSPKGGG